LQLLLLFVIAPVPVIAQQRVGDTGSSAGLPANQPAFRTFSFVSTNQQDGNTRATNCSAKLGEQTIDAPLSPHCKFVLFVRQTYSPYTLVSIGYEAIWAQATDQWPHYGGGMAGFGKRFGAISANTESRRFIQSFALSTLLHQDPRYFPSCKKGLIDRAWYAATRVVVGTSDSGHPTFNSAEFLGALFASSLQNAYYPRHDRRLGDTMYRFQGALSSDATSYILREFTPDIKRLFEKHTPEKIKKMERKLPIPADDKP